MFDELLGDFPGGVLVFDDEGTIVTANDGVLRDR